MHVPDGAVAAEVSHSGQQGLRLLVAEAISAAEVTRSWAGKTVGYADLCRMRRRAATSLPPAPQ